MSLCLEKRNYLAPIVAEKRTPFPEPFFQSPAMVDKRPWLVSAFTELLQLQRTGRLEPGIGDFRITDETLNMAGRILGSIKYRYLPNPSVSALSGGGIQITWAGGTDAVEVTVFPGEGVGVARLVDDAPTKAMELNVSEYDRMNELLADFVSV